MGSARALALGLFILPLSSAGSLAQGWTWQSNGHVEWQPSGRGDRWDRSQQWQAPDFDRRYAPAPGARMDQRQPFDEVRDGGARPAIVPLAPPLEPFQYDYPANSIVIDASERRLYFVLPGRQAFAYQISVGREGFGWTGSEAVSRIQAWPDWHPPAEMRERDPKLPVKMTGGLNNPLGAVALYLGTTLYRIHGTNDERSLGQAQSSGCFRMLNANALHLASLADVGTKVAVIQRLSPPRISRAEPRPDARPPQAPPRSFDRNQPVPEGYGPRRYRSWDDDGYARRDRSALWPEPPVPRERVPATGFGPGYWR